MNVSLPPLEKPFMSTFRISYFPHFAAWKVAGFVSKSDALRPQELWFSSPRAMVLEPKSAFRRGQNLWSWRPTAPSDGSKGCGFGEQGFFQISYFVVNYLLVSQFFITFAGVNIIESWNVLYLTRRR